MCRDIKKLDLERKKAASFQESKEIEKPKYKAIPRREEQSIYETVEDFDADEVVATCDMSFFEQKDTSDSIQDVWWRFLGEDSCFTDLPPILCRIEN